MLKRLKQSSLEVFKTAGLFPVFANSSWRRRRLAVLAYHGVSLDDEHEWDPSLYMSPDDFAERLELLEQNRCTVLPLEEAVERLYRNDLPPRAVALTFDDGNYDFYQQAWPMLKSRGYPATVFLTTYYCDFNRPIFDVACSYLLWKGSRTFDDVPGDAIGIPQRLDLRTRESRERVRSLIFAVCREWRLDAEGKDHLLERLADIAGADYGDLLRKRLLHILSPSEVGVLAAEGVDFQLHTHRHRTPLDRDLFLREIRENRERIQSLTGRDPSYFCYPCGSHRPEFLEWLPQGEVRFATTCQPGLATSGCPALLLPRFVDHASLSPTEFESYVTGLGFLLPGGRNRAGVPADLSRLHASNGR